MIYDSNEQKQMRLGGTCVVHGSRAVFIDQVNTNGTYLASVVPFADRLQLTIDPNDPTLRYMELPLGYANIDANGVNDILYVARTPTRQNRQGLNSSVIRGGQTQVIRWRCSFDGLLRQQGFADMLLGVYPTRDVALKMINDGKAHAVAIGRRFGLVSSGHGWPVELFYRGTKVGWTDGGDKFKLPKEFEFMKETLVEMKLA